MFRLFWDRPSLSWSDTKGETWTLFGFPCSFFWRKWMSWEGIFLASIDQSFSSPRFSGVMPLVYKMAFKCMSKKKTCHLANMDFWVNALTFAHLQKKLRGAHQICSKKVIEQVNVMADLWSYGPNSVALNSVYWHPIFLVDFENTRFEMPGVYLSIRKSLSSKNAVTDSWS